VLDHCGQRKVLGINSETGLQCQRVECGFHSKWGKTQRNQSDCEHLSALGLQARGHLVQTCLGMPCPTKP
jgi:hypothetical protein